MNPRLFFVMTICIFGGVVMAQDAVRNISTYDLLMLRKHFEDNPKSIVYQMTADEDTATAYGMTFVEASGRDLIFRTAKLAEDRSDIIMTVEIVINIDSLHLRRIATLAGASDNAHIRDEWSPRPNIPVRLTNYRQEFALADGLKAPEKKIVRQLLFGLFVVSEWMESSWSTPLEHRAFRWLCTVPSDDYLSPGCSLSSWIDTHSVGMRCWDSKAGWKVLVFHLNQDISILYEEKFSSMPTLLGRPEKEAVLHTLDRSAEFIARP